MTKKKADIGLDSDKIKEFEKLQKENIILRERIAKVIGKNKKTWIMINELINNEIEQEDLCDE